MRRNDGWIAGVNRGSLQRRGNNDFNTPSVDQILDISTHPHQGLPIDAAKCIVRIAINRSCDIDVKSAISCRCVSGRDALHDRRPAVRRRICEKLRLAALGSPRDSPSATTRCIAFTQPDTRASGRAHHRNAVTLAPARRTRSSWPSRHTGQRMGRGRSEHDRQSRQTATWIDFVRVPSRGSPPRSGARRSATRQTSVAAALVAAHGRGV